MLQICHRIQVVTSNRLRMGAKKRKTAAVTTATGGSKAESEAEPKSKKAKTSGSDSTSSDSGAITHWLMKSEPESRLENGIDMKFGLEDLKAEPDQTACWDGVRNYVARNNMMAMKVGQKAFFYHSNCKPPGIAGVVEIVKESYVDRTQFDKKDPHYDPKSKKEKPKWFMVDVKYVRDTKRYIPLHELKEKHLEHKSNKGPLANLALFTKARLSVQGLTTEEFNYILELEDQKK